MKAIRTFLLATLALTRLGPVVALLLGCAPCRAGVSAVYIVYQPIITASESEPTETPKGFLILPVPFQRYHDQGHAPYDAITEPNQNIN